MVREKERLIQAAKAAAMEIVAVPVTSSAEIADAAWRSPPASWTRSVTFREIWFLPDLPGCGSGAQGEASDPRFSKPPSRDGAALVLARDYFDSAREAGLVAARVMRGENPASIPFRNYDKKNSS